MSLTHIIGIGGIGMSAIAQALIDAGEQVSGSDRSADAGDITPTLRALIAQGVRITPQDGSGVTKDTLRVVVSTAIEADNPDLLKAEHLGIPAIHRSAALAKLVAGKRLIAVTGTSGKSTVCAMLGHILIKAGMDPTVINGAAVVGWGSDRRVGSVRSGKGSFCVFEADESDRSLLRFNPEFAIITNISADHFDLEQTRMLFAKFRAGVLSTVIDDEPPSEVLAAETCDGQSFWFNGALVRLTTLGTHNLKNAWQAARMASLTGVSNDVIAGALASFQGVERRLQRVGVNSLGSLVIDDFAHNPAKLEAALRAVQLGCERLAALWRPHGYEPLRKLMRPLARTFAEVLRKDDILFLLPIYDAGGSANRSVSSDDLADAIAAEGAKRPVTLKSLDEASRTLHELSSPETTLLVCGARDPDLPRLAKRLAEA